MDVKFYEAVRVVATLQGATGGVLDVYLQSKWAGAATFYDIAHFAQLPAGAAATTTTFTLRRSAPSSSPVAIGKDLTPALSAGFQLDGDFGELIRVVYVAGAGTSVGAAQSIAILGSDARHR